MNGCIVIIIIISPPSVLQQTSQKFLCLYVSKRNIILSKLFWPMENVTLYVNERKGNNTTSCTALCGLSMHKVPEYQLSIF